MVPTVEQIESTCEALERSKGGVRNGVESLRALDGMVRALRGGSPAGLRAHAERLDGSEAFAWCPAGEGARRTAAAAIAFSRRWELPSV